jgi:hypothetical protein
MIPSVLAGHVEQGIKDFLRTTFPITTPFFSNILEDFLAEPGNAKRIYQKYVLINSCAGLKW